MPTTSPPSPVLSHPALLAGLTPAADAGQSAFTPGSPVTGSPR
ncbi:hypothetical protein ACIGW8_25995 [Streptomyces sioyaensis]